MADAGTTAWSTLGLAASQVSRIIIALLLARILGPEQFAPVAAGAVFMTFVSLSVDLGLVAAIIQRENLTDAHLRVASFTSLVVGGVFTTGTLAACLLGVAGKWGSPAMLVFSTLAFAPLIRSTGLVQLAVLYRKQQQHLIGKVESTVALLALAVCVVSILAGFGVYSYAVSLLAAEIVLAGVWLTRLRPLHRPRWDGRSMRELWSFSSKSFGSDALSVTARNVDSIIVGWLAGPGQLSLYSVGVRFLVTPVQFVGEAIVRVALPEFSERNRKGVDLGPTLVARTGALSRMSWPVLVAAFFISPWAVPFVLGGGWKPAIAVCQALCLAAAVQVSLAFVKPALVSVGAVKPYLVFNAGLVVVSVITYVVGARYGATGVAVGYVVVWIAATPALVAIASRRLGQGPWRLAGAVLSGLPMGIPVAAVALVAGEWTGHPGKQAVVAAATVLLILGISHRRLLGARLRPSGASTPS